MKLKLQNHPTPPHSYTPMAKTLPSSFWAKPPARRVATAVPTANHFQRQNCCNIFCQTSLKADLKKKDLIHALVKQPTQRRAITNYCTGNYKTMSGIQSLYEWFC